MAGPTPRTLSKTDSLPLVIWTVETTRGPIVVREQIEPEDEAAILDLFDQCDDYFEAATGGPSAPGDVQSLFYALPDGASFDDKRLFTVRDGDRIIGLIDAVMRHPTVTSCAIGLFLVAPSHRRQGIGTAVAGVLIDELRELGVRQVTASAMDQVPSGPSFLTSLGFSIGDQSASTSNRRMWAGEATARRATLTLEHGSKSA